MVNCGGKAIIELNVKPEVKIEGPEEVCQDSTVTFFIKDLAPEGQWEIYHNGALYHIDVVDSFTVAFALEGDYFLKFISNDYCLQEPLNIKALPQPAPPNAMEGPDTVCPDIPYLYEAFENDAETSLNWEITGGTSTFAGGSTTASGNKVSASFSGSGPFELRAWRRFKNGLGCVSDTFYKNVYLEDLTDTITGTDTACENTTGSFHIAVEGEVADAYEWSIVPETRGSITNGNGTKSIHVLWNSITASQAVDVVLKMRKCGVEYNDTFSVYLKKLPQLTITAPDTICDGETVQFGITSALPLNSFSTVTWTFGDGTTFGSNTSTFASHSYSSNSEQVVGFKVRATVVLPNGCQTQITAYHDLVVEPIPVAYVSPASFDILEPCIATINDTLYALIQSGFGSTAGYEWFKNDVSLGMGGNALPITGTVGDKYQCVVTGQNGCTDTTNYAAIYCDTSNNSGNPTCKRCATSQTTPVGLSAVLDSCGYVTATGSHPTAYPYGYYWDTDAPWIDTVRSFGTITYQFARAGRHRIFLDFCYFTDPSLPLDTNSLCRVENEREVLVPYLPGLKYDIGCGSGGTYPVTILDHSEYFPQTPITDYQFFVNGNLESSGLTTSFTQNLTPGTHIIRLRIANPNYPPCNLYDTLELPALPVADFDFDFDGACEGYPIKFTNLTTPTGNELSYEWDFGDGAKNTMQSPWRAYSSFGQQFATLVVTDARGCTDTLTKTVNVAENKLGGNIITSPSIACEGSNIILTQLNSDPNKDNPDDYIWQPDSFAIISHPNNNVSVFESGSYFVTLRDDSTKCTFNTQSATVEFVPMPEVVIDGPTEICLDDSLHLGGSAGEGNFTYTWRLNGNTVGTGENLDTLPTQAGTFTYDLTVGISSPVSCTRVSSHTVEVHSPPPVPIVSHNIVDCAPYTIELSATGSGANGLYTWSDGQSGPTVEVRKGGKYTATFTDERGCQSDTSFYVPGSPEEYIWIYPTGCYQLCSEIIGGGERFELPDPIVSFSNWSLDNVGEEIPVTVLSGSNSVPDIYIPNSPYTGEYSFTLQNGSCAQTAETFDLQETSCQCEDMIGVPSQDTLMFSSTPSGCRNSLTLQIAHNHYTTLPVTLSADKGVIVPSVINVPMPSGIFTVEYIPEPGTAPGSADKILMTANMNPTGEPGESFSCFYDFPVFLPNPLCDDTSWYKRGAADWDSSPAASGELKLYPNPAQNTVTLTYPSLGGGEVRPTLTVYDLRGSLVTEARLDGSGRHELNIRELGEGLYLVVVRSDGGALKPKRLLIAR